MNIIKILTLQILVVACMAKDIQAGTIPPSFIDSVVAIYEGEAVTPASQLIPAATGFLVKKNREKSGKSQKSNKLYLVTNKHVLKDKTNIPIRFNDKSGTTPKRIDILVEKWTPHHSGTVDVVVVEIDEQDLKEMKYSHFNLDEDSLGITQMNKQGISEGDFVYVLGYPMKLVGTSKKEYPIVRSGSIALIRDHLDEQYGTFLVDAFTFPGNSGGPVILIPEVINIKGSKPVAKPSLIGIVMGYIPYKEDLINLQTNKIQMSLTQNSGLTEVIPVDYILQTIDAAEKKSP